MLEKSKNYKLFNGLALRTSKGSNKKQERERDFYESGDCNNDFLPTSTSTIIASLAIFNCHFEKLPLKSLSILLFSVVADFFSCFCRVEPSVSVAINKLNLDQIESLWIWNCDTFFLLFLICQFCISSLYPYEVHKTAINKLKLNSSRFEIVALFFCKWNSNQQTVVEYFQIWNSGTFFAMKLQFFDVKCQRKRRNFNIGIVKNLKSDNQYFCGFAVTFRLLKMRNPQFFSITKAKHAHSAESVEKFRSFGLACIRIDFINAAKQISCFTFSTMVGFNQIKSMRNPMYDNHKYALELMI